MLFIFNNKVLKIFAIQALILTTILSYYQIRYGVLINRELLLSVFETSPREAFVIANDIYFLFLLLLTLLASYIFIWRIQLFGSLKTQRSICIILLSFFMFIFTAIVDYPYLRMVLKESFTQVAPMSIYSQGGSYVKSLIRYRNVIIDTVIYDDLIMKNQQDMVVVLVLGESARTHNFELNGYARNTNPLLSQRSNLVSFTDTTSCATSTSFSVPCLLSRQGRDSGFRFPRDEASIVYAFGKLGFTTSYYSVQETQYNKFIFDICNEAESCVHSIQGKDEVLIDYLKNQVSKGGRQFIILHTNGSHFLYYTAYPASFSKFKPECKKSSYYCEYEHTINAYDNSVLYTDFVLNEFMEFLSDKPSILFYTSDHGESLGEFGRHGHASSFHLTPDFQKKVPFIIWISELFPNVHNILKNAYNYVDSPLKHENLFHSMLDCVGSEGSAINRSLSVCYEDLINE